MTHQLANSWWRVSEWEFHEAVRRTREAEQLPRGQRTPEKRRIAADYGVSVKTLERWLGYSVQTVACGKYRAMFVISTGRPSQVTPWEKAA
jgi:DNA-binding transcriptional MocR family regulator